MIRQFSTILALTAVFPSLLAGQDTGSPDDAAGAWRLHPHLIVATAAPRWEGYAGDTFLLTELGWAPRPMLAAGLDHRLRERLTLEVLAGFTQTDYAIDDPHQSIRGVGKIRLMRFSAGVQLRLREDVPGFFSAGAGVIHYNPIERMYIVDTATGEPVARFVDDTQLMPGAYIGVGLDQAMEEDRAVRWEFRISGSRSSQEEVRVQPGGKYLDAHWLVLDYLFSVGLVFPLQN